MTQLDHALAMVNLRIAVFPCKQNKSPHTANGFKDASRDPRQVSQWWTHWPDAKIGYLPCTAGGAICVDVDEGGKDAVREVIRVAQAKAWCVLPSGRQGHYHILFLWDPSVEITEGNWKQAWGVGEIRYQKGYIIAHHPAMLVKQMTERDDYENYLTSSLGQLKSNGAGNGQFVITPDNAATRRTATPPPPDDRNAVRHDDASERNANAFGLSVYSPKYPDDLDDAVRQLANMKENRRTYLNGATLKFAAKGTPDDQLRKLLEAMKTNGYHNMRDAERCFNIACADGKDTERTDETTFDVTDEGFAKALQHIGYALKFDIRRQQILWRRGNGKWESSTDRLSSHVRMELRKHCFRIATRYRKPQRVPYQMNKDEWTLARDALAYQNEVDPFREWIKQLPEWDRTERLETALTVVLGADDTPLNRFASVSILLGAIRRAFDPGCEHKTMPVFIGPQHKGKSSYIQWLMPETRRSAWVGEKLPIKARSSRELIEAVLGNVIVEYAELGDVGWNIEHLKAFLSTRTDKVRLAWRTDAEEMPRRCIFVGTSNPKGTGELPNDPTGLVRFVAIAVSGCPHGSAYAYDWMETNRDQLWSEAYHQYLSGADSNIPESLIEAQAKVNLEYRDMDEIYETVLKRLIIREVIYGEMTMVDIGNIILREEQAVIKDIVQPRLAKALMNVGAVKIRVRKDASQHRVWRIPSIRV